MAWTSPRTWVTGEVVTAAHMNAHVRDNFDAGFPAAVTSSAWSAVLSGTTSGSVNASTARQWRVGPMQWVAAFFTGIVSGEVVGTFQVTLPVAASGIATSNQPIGSFRGVDDSTSAREAGAVILASSTTIRFGGSGGLATNTIPWTWATADILAFSAFYPVA